MAELLTLREAVERFVNDGDTVALEGFTHLIPTAASHELIRQGATLVETVEHILEGLRGWTQCAPVVALAPEMPPHPLVDLLRAAPQSSEQLALRSGLELPQVLVELIELELDGRVACEAGVWVHRAP